MQLSGRLRLPASCTAEKNKSKTLPWNSHYDWTRKRGQVNPSKPLDPEQVRTYFEKKHFPLLFNPGCRIKIQVNGRVCSVKEPVYSEKFPFDSLTPFRLGSEEVPAQPEAKFGRLAGTFYVADVGDMESGIHIFDRMGQRLDKYSGTDWLGLKGKLERGAGFTTKVMGFVNAKTEVVMGEAAGAAGCLLVKSDRSGFFEDTLAFKQAVDYLIGSRESEALTLPSGGILRLIHKHWMQGQRESSPRAVKMAEKEIPVVVSILTKLFKNESVAWKGDPTGKVTEKPRKKGESLETPYNPPENKRMKCPYCGAINYISIIQYKVWRIASEDSKEKMKKNWPCKVCGTYLDPDTDLHKIASPLKVTGKIAAKVSLGQGKLVDLRLESMGKAGELASYSVGDEAIFINQEHSLFGKAAEFGDRTLRFHMVNAAIFSVASAVSREGSEGFNHVYNRMCSRTRESWEL